MVRNDKLFNFCVEANIMFHIFQYIFITKNVYFKHYFATCSRVIFQIMRKQIALCVKLLITIIYKA